MKLVKSIGLSFLFVFSISGCKNNDQPKAKKTTPKTTIKDFIANEDKTIIEDATTIDYTTAPVDFLEEKYKQSGFVLEDAVPPFAKYTFFDKDLGGFGVNYIGKSKLIQDYWSVYNAKGFVSQFEHPDQAFQNSKEVSDKIKRLLENKSNDYSIIADFLPKEAISKYYDDGSGEFELKDNAYTYFYIYEDKNWVFIKKILTTTIGGQGISLYNKLLQFHKLNSIKPITGQ